MRKPIYLTWLIIILCLIGGSRPLYAAVETPDYLESFTGLKTTSHDFAPVNWGHIVESAFDEETYEDLYVNYTAVLSGGQVGAYLKAGSQILVYGASKEINDLLVTPLVKGTVSFYLKKNSASGNIKLFTCTKSGTRFVRDQEIILDLPELSTSSWTKISLELEDYTYLGIRLDNMSIDEFSAAWANIPDVRAMKIASFKITSSQNPDTDPTGIIHIEAKMTVTNTGNVALKPGDEGFSFNLVNYSNGNEVIGEPKAGDFILPVGATSDEINLSADYQLDPAKEHRIRIDGQENATGTTAFGAWIEVKAYLAKLELTPVVGYGSLTSLDFETFKGERSADINLKNAGGAPLEMTAIDLPEGYSINSPISFTMQPGESMVKTITLGGESGVKAGNIQFVFEGSGDKTVEVKGVVVAPDAWLEDFEDGLPDSWIIPSGSSWSINTEKSTTYSKKNMKNSMVTLTPMISPKVSVKEGESLYFSVARVSSTSTSPLLQIRYSDNRSEWSEPIEIPLSDLVQSFSGFKTYSTDAIPAGEYYLSFEAGYLLLDNINGYRLANVEHDIYIESMKVPGSGTVNHPVEITATLRNMTDKTETADAFKVALTEDGKTVGTASATELAAKETKDFSLSYTPHEAGEHTLKLVISTADGYITRSADFIIRIGEEVAADEVIVGNAAKTTNSVPFRLGYNNSMSETVYKKSQLNLNEGNNIIKIAFPYYSTGKDYSTHVSVWLQNTTDEAPSGTAFADTTQMTKVYYSPKYTFTAGGTSTNFMLAEFQLPESFVYTGENLRVMVMANDVTYSGSIYFGYDDKIANSTNYKYADPAGSFPGASLNKFTTGLPVVHLFIGKSVPTVSGKVTAENQAVGGVEVSLISGDVLYNSTTDASGNYSVPVFQAGKEYTLTVDKIGYVVARSLITVGESDLADQDFEIEPTGAKIVNAGNIDVTTTDRSVALEGTGWTAERIGQLASSLGTNPSVTGIDMSHIDLPEGITATFDRINPSCLIYVKKDAVIPHTWNNVVKGDRAELVTLDDKAPFTCIKPFTAGNIRYRRTAHTTASSLPKANASDVMETICLPYAVNTLPEGCSVKEFKDSSEGKVTFETRAFQTMEAGVPYLLTVQGGTAMDFQANDAEIFPGNPSEVQSSGYSYCGTYVPVADGAVRHYYVFDGARFLKAGASTNIPAFRAYFKVNGDPAAIQALSINIDGSGTTRIVGTNTTQGLSAVALPDGKIQISVAGTTAVSIIASDGRIVRRMTLAEGVHTVSGLPGGIYLVNTQKIVVK